MRKTLLAIPLAAALAACAPAGSPAPEGSGSLSSAPGVEKQYGGIFIKAPLPILESLYWYDKVNGANSGQRSSITDLTDTLLNYNYTTPDEDYRTSLAPGLAESWKQIDQRTYEFPLRKGVKFHDGEPFTSKDVVFSLERMKEGTGGQAAATRQIEKVEALDSHTVRFTLRQVSPDFIDVIGADNSSAFRIIPAHVAERAGNPTGDALKDLYNKNPIGTGPFKFRSFTYNQQLELERFDDHWRGKPYMDGIRTVQRLDRSAQQAAYISGKVDFLSLTDRIQFDTVKQQVPETKKVTYVLSNGVGLEYNIRRKPFDDVRVRKALHLGLDRQAIHATATFGEGFIQAPMLQPEQSQAGIGLPIDEYMELPGWRQPKEQDIAEAKRLLAEAGYPNGFKMVLKYQRGSNHPEVLTEPTGNQLRQNLGLDVSIQPVEDAAYLAQIQREYDFDAVVSVQAAGAGEFLSVTPASKWHSGGTTNYNGYNDPDLDRIMEALRTELDVKKKSELVLQAQRIMIDKAYYAPLMSLAQYNAVQGWVNDFYTSYSANSAPRNMGATWLEVNRLPSDRRSW